MKEKFKLFTQKLVNGLLELMSKSNYMQYIFETTLNYTFTKTSAVSFNNIQLLFHIPNRINSFRIHTFATKEPETLEWIDNFDEGSIFWDIGANIGLYSCYAAKSKNCDVYSFEPSVFNIELLARNIYVNNLEEQITIIPIPLHEKTAVSEMVLSSVAWGSALSTFGENYGHDGKLISEKFKYRTIGLNMDDCLSILGLPAPKYLKIDVDGIEHLILKGGSNVLRNVKSIIVEINDDFELQKNNCRQYLLDAGLEFQSKQHSTIFVATEFQNSYNQIWVRN